MFPQIRKALSNRRFWNVTVRKFSEKNNQLKAVKDQLIFGKNLPNSPDINALKDYLMMYVDKSMLIYDLLNEGGSVKLLRPRQFGKSLVLSVAETIVTMNKTVIEKLAVKRMLTNSIKHPVIRFDFSQRKYSIDPVSELIDDAIKEHSIILNYTPYLRNGDLGFEEILKEYCRKGPAPYILIDEYDSPLCDHRNSVANLARLISFFKL